MLGDHCPIMSCVDFLVNKIDMCEAHNVNSGLINHGLLIVGVPSK